MKEPLVSGHPHAEAGIGVGGAAAAVRPPRWEVSRWVCWVTYAAILAPLPSAVWRLGLAAGQSRELAVAGSPTGAAAG